MPFPNWSDRTRLIVGDAEKAAANFQGQVKTRLFLALFFTAAAIAVVWMFVSSNS